MVNMTDRGGFLPTRPYMVPAPHANGLLALTWFPNQWYRVSLETSNYKSTLEKNHTAVLVLSPKNGL